MKELRDKKVFTIAQDEESSVVWGMAGSAVKLEAAEKANFEKVRKEFFPEKSK